MAKIARYPGWRTMTAAQRRSARHERIWDDARARAAKTPGQLAYEAELKAKPNYDTTGRPRPAWGELDALTQWTWERNPTPRWTVDNSNN